MYEELKQETNDRMQKCVASLKHELGKIRTGRAHPNLLEQIKVLYYGSPVPLNQVANINVTDPQTLLVGPWEKTLIPQIEKAIRDSDLGLNPIASNEGVRVPLPPLTEQRRKELNKIVKNSGEESKIGIRNIRRDANQDIKEALKAKEITEDEERRYQEEIQKLTDKYIKEIDAILTTKEHELMEF